MVSKALVCVGVILLLVLCAGCIGSPGPDKKIPDSDKDGYNDVVDRFPTDPKEWNDTDGDHHGDNSDKFPTDPTEWNDSDGDHHGDNSDKFPADPSEWNDTDGDGWGDNRDKFPLDPKEWNDTDGDGWGDNRDKFPGDPTDWNDTDGDGYGDNLDAFPLDPKEWKDSDSDGVGDNRDDYPLINGASARLNVSFSGHYYIGADFHIFGMITNNKTVKVGGGPYGGYNISAKLYINGTFFKYNYTMMTLNTNTSLAPGDTLPFYIDIKDEQHQATSYTVEAMSFYWNSTPRHYLSAKNLSGYYNATLHGYFMNGSMWNNQTFTLSNVHYVVVFYNSTGGIVDVRAEHNGGGPVWPAKPADISAWSPAPKANTITGTKVWFFYK